MHEIEAYSDTNYGYNIIITRDASVVFDCISSVSDISNVVGVMDPYIADVAASADIQVELLKAVESMGAMLHIYNMDAGKDSKNLVTIGRFCEWLLEARIGRDTLFVAVGGGVIGDLVGFVASTYFRGCKLFHLPTNVLAMCDSSIGGKTAINTSTHVNTLGTYKHPVGNVMYLRYLDTLSARDFRAGLAEIIKISLLRRDSPVAILLKEISKKPELDLANSHEEFEELLARAVSEKVRFTSDDIFEENKRLFLNFGHTFGHAVETLLDLDKEEYYRHGEAVALGLICAANMGDSMYGTRYEDLIKNLLARFKLPTELSMEYIRLSEVGTRTELIGCLASNAYSDKKSRRGKPRIVLLDSDGSPTMFNEVTEEQVRCAFEAIVPKGFV